MMTEKEILKLIQDGESSKLEFKEDKVDNLQLAREVIAFANLKGGVIFLGVNDDGKIVGLTRSDNEERVMNICTDLVYPRIIPVYEEKKIGEKRIALIQMSVGVEKPYLLKEKNKNIYYIRVGSSVRESSREELLRMFQESGKLFYELSPVYNTSLENLNRFKINNYLKRMGVIYEDEKQLEKILTNKHLLKEDLVTTSASLALFGNKNIDILKQHYIQLTRYKGNEQNYDIISEKKITASLIDQHDQYTDEVVEAGLIERALSFIGEHIEIHSFIKGAKREEGFQYPMEAIRELIVNSVAHRDYSIEGAGIRVFIFDNKIQIISPGSLPNTISVQNLKEGVKVGVVPIYARNPLITEILKTFNFIEHTGMGLAKKVYRLIKEQGLPDPLFEDFGHSFSVTLFGKRI